MYKTFYLLIAAASWAGMARAQGYLHALNTTGSTGTAGGTTISYSVGETVAFANSCSYTPGVIQPTCVCIVDAVNEVFDEKYRSNFYPNPAHSHIFVETDFPGFTGYTIHSADGKLVETGRFTYSPIGVTGLSPGTYFLRLSDAKNQIFKTVKIIKQ